MPESSLTHESTLPGCLDRVAAIDSADPGYGFVGRYAVIPSKEGESCPGSPDAAATRYLDPLSKRPIVDLPKRVDRVDRLSGQTEVRPCDPPRRPAFLMQTRREVEPEIRFVTVSDRSISQPAPTYETTTRQCHHTASTSRPRFHPLIVTPTFVRHALVRRVGTLKTPLPHRVDALCDRDCVDER